MAVIDKPAGVTSHDVVGQVRKALHTRKVGHAGTLDPGATGVLLVGVGRVTRLLRFLTARPKAYVGELVLGVETTTLDADGEVVARHDMAGIDAADVEAAAAGFVGAISQIPPMVSAVKVGGRRLHELAREGVEVERDARPVTVDELTVEQIDELVYRMRVRCSSGTYVRTLAADIGAALGGGAHLRALRRTAIGSFTEAEARPVEALGLLPPAAAMRDYPALTVDADAARFVANGRVLPDEDVSGPGPWGVLDTEGRLLAVYERHRPGTIKPAVVLPS